ncbi:HAMP domain-containing histidine kinase, partial [bacterium]|nr:HAMP domain-containing histidine kinase [bacterium]
VEISFARINPDEGFKRFVGVIRDVTEQKKADRLRDDFIATLTHDLRTPLLAAIQTLKFFLDGALGELDEKQKLLLSTMQKSNEDLLGLVNALLEVYKYDAEKLVLNKNDFNIYELTKLVYDELKPLADSKKIDFSIDCADEALEINADRSELRRVICNLCGNAINYTQDEGKVVITIKNEANDLIFSVSDNGCGIPQEDIPNMFQRFSQGTSKKRSAGTGLGLYLSRQIIESHGGKIWLESVVNKGSEFSFILTDAVSVSGVLR